MEIANNKNEIERNKTKAYLEKGAIVQDEAQSYLDFATFINDNLLFETEELPKLIGNLTSRSTSIAQQGYNEGILQSLSRTPNYNTLKREILNQPTFNTQATSNSATAQIISYEVKNINPTSYRWCHGDISRSGRGRNSFNVNADQATEQWIIQESYRERYL